MAFYKYQRLMEQSSHSAFDHLYSPATQTPYSGIYRCKTCGHEVVSTVGHPLPPQNHHQHAQHQPIQWQLNVATSGS